MGTARQLVRKGLRKLVMCDLARKQYDRAEAKTWAATVDAENQVASIDACSIDEMQSLHRRIDRLLRYKTRLYRISIGTQPFGLPYFGKRLADEA